MATALVGTTAGVQSVGVGLHVDPVSNKDIKVPDNMVGFIIGRRGQQIMKLQAISGCKIQMAPDSGGLSERICTLTGNPESIAKAEELITEVVQTLSRKILPSENEPISP